MILKKTVLIAFLAVTILGVTVFSFIYFPQDSFAFGIKIANQKVGGLSKEVVKTRLTQKIDRFLQSEINFIFSSNEIIETVNTTPQEIGLVFDIEKTLQLPFKVGKERGVQEINLGFSFHNFKAKILALQGKYNFPLYVGISIDNFDKFLTESFGKYEVFPKNAEPIFDEKSLDFKIREPQEGLLFEKDNIKEEIKKDAQNLNINDVYLVLKKALPEIGLEEAQEAKKDVKSILEVGPYILFIENKVFVINEKILGNWFTFSPQEKDDKKMLSISLDPALMEDYLIDIAPSVNINPKSPTLSFQEGSLEITSPSKTGKVLDVGKSIDKIQEKILNKESKILLSLTEAEPEITEARIAELKIETLIGEGTSNFGGSPNNRKQNIKIGSSKFNGVLIGPGKIFSFNQILGEVGPAQGYLPELVIKDNKTIPEYGGGICQVSTTMFRVAVNSGMEILERRPHAFPVSYYSWPYGQGFDATVYLPSPDLRFKNNTTGHILIQSRIEGNYLTFDFYGVDDKRKVIVRGPYQYDIKSDGSMKARLHQEVWRDGTLIVQKTFFSSYKSPSLYPIQRNPLE